MQTYPITNRFHLRTVRHKLKQEGSTLILSMFLALTVSMVISSYLSMLTGEYRLVHRSHEFATAINLAEAGVEEGMGMLNYGDDNWVGTGWTHLGGNVYTKTANNFTPVGSTRAIGGYTVTVYDAFGDTPRIEATGITTAGIQASATSRHVQARAARRPTFRWGLLAKSTIDLKGNNLMLDSFDSSDPNYSNYNILKGYGQYDTNKRKDNGDAATNSSITNSIAVGNANVFGHVATGPGGSVSIGPNGFVGTLTNYVNGLILPGRISHSMNVDLPPPAIPFTSGISLGNVTSSTTLNGGAVTPVDYVASSISLSSSKTLTFANGYSRLYVTGNLSVSGNASIVIQEGSKVEIYTLGTVSIAGNGVVNENYLADRFHLYKRGLDSVSVSGNGVLAAVVYAPESAVSFNGGGSGGVVIGSIVGDTITLNGHVEFHYDEALRKHGPTRGYMITSWKED